eukprot:141801-Hanusia_phi.AAC.1
MPARVLSTASASASASSSSCPAPPISLGTGRGLPTTNACKGSSPPLLLACPRARMALRRVSEGTRRGGVERWDRRQNQGTR